MLAFTPAATSAGTGTFRTYTAAPGEVNNVVVTGNGTGVTITDSASATVGSECSQVNPTTISCVGESFTFNLGDQNDTFSYAGGSFPHVGPGTNSVKVFDIDGGAGSDSISGSLYDDAIRGGFVLSGDGPDVLRGGDGDDNVNGDDDGDTILGEGGNDSVEGGDGNDTADGGPGNDGIDKSFHGGGCSGPDTMIGGPGLDSFAVSCGEPTLQFRDGEADTGNCAKSVTSAVKEYDKVDKVSGAPACATLVCKKKKKKKGKKRSASTAASAAKKGKKKKKKCKPYKAPEDISQFAAPLGAALTLTRP